MEKTKPLLFCDVDGVLNCLSMMGGKYDLLSEQPGAFGMVAMVPPGMPVRFAKLRERFEIFWATGHGSRAHHLFAAHLGLPREPYPCLSQGGYKLPAMVETAGRRPFAWVDDEAGWESRRFGDLGNAIAQPHLIISVDRERGLSDDDTDKLVDFAASL